MIEVLGVGVEIRFEDVSVHGEGECGAPVAEDLPAGRLVSRAHGTGWLTRLERHNREPDARDGDDERHHRRLGTARRTFAASSGRRRRARRRRLELLAHQQKGTPHLGGKVPQPAGGFRDTGGKSSPTGDLRLQGRN
jgi:hypothetical protein